MEDNEGLGGQFKNLNLNKSSILYLLIDIIL